MKPHLKKIRVEYHKGPLYIVAKGAVCWNCPKKQKTPGFYKAKRTQVRPSLLQDRSIDMLSNMKSLLIFYRLIISKTEQRGESVKAENIKLTTF